MVLLHGSRLFWAYYGLSLASIGAFAVAAFCLLRPRRVLALYRQAWQASLRLAGTPGMVDEADARHVGLMFLLVAVILAGSTFVYHA